MYYSLFSKLEDDNLLHIERPIHIAILHRIFIPRMRRHLKIFRESWNLHPISSGNNLTPQQLMLMHLPPQEFDLPMNLVNEYIFC